MTPSLQSLPPIPCTCTAHRTQSCRKKREKKRNTSSYCHRPHHFDLLSETGLRQPSRLAVQPKGRSTIPAPSQYDMIRLSKTRPTRVDEPAREQGNAYRIPCACGCKALSVFSFLPKVPPSAHGIIPNEGFGGLCELGKWHGHFEYIYMCVCGWMPNVHYT